MLPCSRLLQILAFGVALAATFSAPIASEPAPSLPASLPAAERTRLQEIVEGATLSTHVRAEPFVARRDVFEYLLDHPEFASHVTRTLRFARYKIWRGDDGLFMDDGWGATGRFWLVHAGPATRVMHAKGQYQPRLLPDIHGQAVVVIDYQTAPAPEGGGKDVIQAAVTGFVKLDSRVLAAAGRMASSAASAKAEKEARRLVKVFAKTSRAIEADPASVYAQLRQRPDVPKRELEGFRHLLGVR